MKVLIVARCKQGRYAPFITEQVEALEKSGVECRYFGINKKGLSGYLQHIKGLKQAIDNYHPDIIHAHYGLCGLLANLQRKVPVVTTYHGSDINEKHLLRLSKWAIRFSAFNIFVSQGNIDIAQPGANRFALIPCGINLKDYPIVDKQEARHVMGLKQDGNYILFAGAFDNAVKNAPLAKAAADRVLEAELIELKGFTRDQVSTLMQAVDALLMTSLTEGSPQVIKEAMACGCPIVSVDVGDVKQQVESIDGCFISNRNPEELASYIRKALKYGNRTKGRQAILEKGLTNDIIATRIIDIYRSLI